MSIRKGFGLVSFAVMMLIGSLYASHANAVIELAVRNGT